MPDSTPTPAHAWDLYQANTPHVDIAPLLRACSPADGWRLPPAPNQYTLHTP